MNATLLNTTLSSVDYNSVLSSLITVFILTINLLVGFPLNCYIIKQLFTRDGGVDISVIFVLSQSASEIIFCYTAPIIILCFVTRQACLMKPLGFLVGCCMSARPLFQCCVCVERYIAVVHPVTFLKYKYRYRLLCTLGVWMYSLSCGIAYMIYFPHISHTVLGIMYAVVLLIDIFCCVSILNVLWQPKPGDGQVEEVAMDTAKKKAFELVSINLLTLLVQTIPSAAVFGLQYLFSSQSDFDLAVSLTFFSNIIAGFVQPLVFLHQVGKLTCLRCS